MAEEVTVIGDTPVVDTQTNQVSTNYDKDWVRNAPVPRFSMFDLLAASPGVSQSTQGVHHHVGLRLGDRRELVPDRRHQPDRVLHGGGLALSQHRRHRGDRGAGPGRARGVRQRHGGGLQRGDPPGHERLPRRRQLLLPEPGPDEPQHHATRSAWATRMPGGAGSPSTARSSTTRPSSSRDPSSRTSSGSSPPTSSRPTPRARGRRPALLHGREGPPGLRAS